MDETIKIWLNHLYDRELKEAIGTIHNERIFSDGYDGEEPNPHEENIRVLTKYCEILRDLKEKL